MRRKCIKIIEGQYMFQKISKRIKNFPLENIKVIRPGYGLEPKFYDKIIGKKF